MLDKEARSNDDIGDALRLVCLNVRFTYREKGYHHTNVDPNTLIKRRQQQTRKLSIENLFRRYPWTPHILFVTISNILITSIH